jgi:hypothetical protein
VQLVGDSDPVTNLRQPKFVAPYWLPAVLIIAFLVLPWLPWWSKGFSLRTLLIATTLVAVAIAAIAYLIKPPDPEWESPPKKWGRLGYSREDLRTTTPETKDLAKRN